MVDVLLPHVGFIDYVIEYNTNHGDDGIKEFFESHTKDPLFFTRHVKFSDGTEGYICYNFEFLDPDEIWPYLVLLAVGTFNNHTSIKNHFDDLVAELKTEYGVDGVCASYGMCKHFNIDVSNKFSFMGLIMF